MDCLSVLATTTNQNASSVGCGDKALKFAQMIEKQPAIKDVYVSESFGTGNKNPLTDIIANLQSMSFSSKPSQQATNQDHNSGKNDGQSMGDSVLSAQAELLRTVMMMEVMSTTKQGVTTLFQQQG
jgi:hypothetical protein